MNFQQPDAIFLIALGSVLSLVMIFTLPTEKLTLALPIASAIIGGGLMEYRGK